MEDESVINVLREQLNQRDEVIKLYRNMLNDKHLFNKSMEARYVETYKEDIRNLEFKEWKQGQMIDTLNAEKDQLKEYLKIARRKIKQMNSENKKTKIKKDKKDD